jgi:hypothetical protein
MKVKIYRKVGVCIISILLIIASCGKEKTDLLPEITLYSPVNKQVFNVLDTIRVSGILRDDKNLTTVKVVLTGAEFNPVHKAFYFYPGSAEFILEFGYPLDNVNLAGGKHYLHVRAEDGINFRNFYQEISLVEIPQALKQVVVLTAQQGSSIQLTGIDPDDQMSALVTIEGDYVGSDIGSGNSQLYIAGKNHLNLLAFDLNNLNIAWKLPTALPFPMHRAGCLYFDEYLFASFNYDYIFGYNASGAVIFNSSVNESDAPTRVGRSGNYVLADIQKKNSEPSYIKTMFLITGKEKQRIYTSFDVIEFHPATSDIVIITANNGDNGLILKYDIEQNLLFTEHTLTGRINCSLKTDETNYLIGSDDAILNYNSGLNQYSVLNTNEGTLKLAYDILNGFVYGVWDNKIHVYQYPQMQYQKTFPFSDTILNLHLQYAKKE